MQAIPKYLLIAGGILALGTIGTIMDRGPHPGVVQAQSTSSVEVVNPRTSPVQVFSVDSPLQNPYMGTCTFTTSSGIGSCTLTPPVTGGRRLAIQNVSMSAAANLGTPFQLVLQYTANGSPWNIQLQSSTPSFPQQNALVNQLLTAYPDAGTTPSCSARFDTGFGFGGGSLQCIVSGYLTPATAPVLE